MRSYILTSSFLIFRRNLCVLCHFVATENFILRFSEKQFQFQRRIYEPVSQASNMKSFQITLLDVRQVLSAPLYRYDFVNFYVPFHTKKYSLNQFIYINFLKIYKLLYLSSVLRLSLPSLFSHHLCMFKC